MAEGKVVLLLQEEATEQPVDYRDVVQTYDTPDQIRKLLAEPINQIIRNMQTSTAHRSLRVPRTLERLDLGDVAAENEIQGLRDYFVRTGQFQQAVRGHARLIVGRKGTGKTAMFYEIRNFVGRGHARIVLDMKPEGHQFRKLREVVLSELPEGVQEHTLVGFWNYLLLCEIALKVLRKDLRIAERDPVRFQKYRRVEDVYRNHGHVPGDDLSQRLLRQVDRLIDRFGDLAEREIRSRLTEIVYENDIDDLERVLIDYLEEKEEIWLLVDNLDKGWKAKGSTSEDVLIVRALLVAARKVQEVFEQEDVALRCLVFLRTDIYEHLLRDIPDKNKEMPIRLDCDDKAVLEEIVRKRVIASLEIDEDVVFEDVWRTISEPHVESYDSFAYIAERTLMRPRDLLMFLQEAVQVAVNRGHEIITADDIRQAELSYSEDMLLTTGYEIEDTALKLADLLFAFQGGPIKRSAKETRKLLIDWGLESSEAEGV